EAHYDPAYARAARRETRRGLGRLDLSEVTAESLAAAADQALALAARL
ncbi:MAG: hypothetical protein JSR98_05040, partial [Proteobacteria bacterium]|nr:hypothetical protein [Pseudomonadota bacterium]